MSTAPALTKDERAAFEKILARSMAALSLAYMSAVGRAMARWRYIPAVASGEGPVLSENGAKKVMSAAMEDWRRRAIPEPSSAYSVLKSVLGAELDALLPLLMKGAFFGSGGAALEALAAVSGTKIAEEDLDKALASGWKIASKMKPRDQAALVAVLLRLTATEEEEPAETIEEAVERENAKLTMSLTVNEKTLKDREAMLSRAEQWKKERAEAKAAGKEWKPPTWEEAISAGDMGMF